MSVALAQDGAAQGAPTSALKSVNSSPLQSNSRMLTVLGGSVWGYVAGAALMLAECSLLQFLHLHTKLASPLLPLTSFCSKRLTETMLGCVSRHEVHWTLKV
jgi:hypothetical protein